MPLSENNFSALLEPKLREVFFETYDELDEQYTQLFNVDDSQKATETDHHVATNSSWEEKDPQGSIQFSKISDGQDATYTHTEYADGFEVERRFVDDELYDVIEKLPASLARNARAFVEQKAADVLNNGFSNTGYDSTSLFSDSHTDSGDSALTQDNKLTDALSDSGLKNAIILARGQKDNNDTLIQVRPDVLVVPPDLEFTAIEILESQRKSGTADNDINSVNMSTSVGGRMELLVMDFLTDANNWFIADSRLHELNFFWRIRPEFKAEEAFNTMVAKYRGYMRFSQGYSNWRGLVGSQVA